jgi:hypothetical protein
MDEPENSLIANEVEEVAKPTASIFDPKSFNRIEDEQMLLSREDFLMVARDMLHDYELTLKDANDYQNSRHTFTNWLNSFLGYISW